MRLAARWMRGRCDIRLITLAVVLSKGSRNAAVAGERTRLRIEKDSLLGMRDITNAKENECAHGGNVEVSFSSKFSPIPRCMCSHERGN